MVSKFSTLIGRLKITDVIPNDIFFQDLNWFSDKNKKRLQSAMELLE